MYSHLSQFDQNNGPWIMFEGSAGDLYLLGSLLYQTPLINNYNFKLIVPVKNLDLLRVFVGNNWIEKHCDIYDDQSVAVIREILVVKKWRYSKLQFFDCGMPFTNSDAIYTTILADNPALSKLMAIGRITQYEAIGLMLKLDIGEAVPHLPYFYTPEDRSNAKSIVSSLPNHCSILLHAVNHTAKSLSNHDLVTVIQLLEQRGIQVAVNASQAKGEFKSFLYSNFNCIEIPLHLMPLVASKFKINTGVIGGALTISQLFAKTNTCQIFKPSFDWTEMQDCMQELQLSSNGQKLYGWDFYNFENMTLPNASFHHSFLDFRQTTHLPSYVDKLINILT